MHGEKYLIFDVISRVLAGQDKVRKNGAYGCEIGFFCESTSNFSEVEDWMAAGYKGCGEAIKIVRKRW